MARWFWYRYSLREGCDLHGAIYFVIECSKAPRLRGLEMVGVVEVVNQEGHLFGSRWLSLYLTLFWNPMSVSYLTTSSYQQSPPTELLQGQHLGMPISSYPTRSMSVKQEMRDWWFPRAQCKAMHWLSQPTSPISASRSLEVWFKPSCYSLAVREDFISCWFLYCFTMVESPEVET